MSPLTTLKEGKSSIIEEIDSSLNRAERRRLLDLGIYPGVSIKNCFKSASGDPKAYEVLGTVIALRKEQAEKIYLKEN
ncbi:MAG: FeoA family protein [Balneolaceae bacterium]